MKPDLPPYVSSELQADETLISHVPQPDLAARRRIILAISPLFVIIALTLAWSLTDRRDGLASAAALFCLIALFIYAVRLCRTSYLISDRRLVRFVKGQTVEEVELSESSRPILRDYSASKSLVHLLSARLFSLGPFVEICRLKPIPWSVAAFFHGRDPSRVRIGYPGHSLPIIKLFDDATLAWEAAQSTPKTAE